MPVPVLVDARGAASIPAAREILQGGAQLLLEAGIAFDDGPVAGHGDGLAQLCCAPLCPDRAESVDHRGQDGGCSTGDVAGSGSDEGDVLV